MGDDSDSLCVPYLSRQKTPHNARNRGSFFHSLKTSTKRTIKSFSSPVFDHHHHTTYAGDKYSAQDMCEKPLPGHSNGFPLLLHPNRQTGRRRMYGRRRAVTAPEAAVWVHPRRPGIICDGNKRHVGSSAPSDRVSGVKPAFACSFTTIETSAEGTKESISSAVTRREAVVWASGATLPSVRCRGYLDLGTEATSSETVTPTLRRFRAQTHIVGSFPKILAETKKILDDLQTRPPHVRNGSRHSTKHCS